MGEMMHFPDTVEEFMELFKVIDSDHVYSNGIEFVPIFRMQQWFDHLNAQSKTEGDKIRAMTDEELAKAFHLEGCPKGKSILDCRYVLMREPYSKECEKCWLDWLKQHVTE